MSELLKMKRTHIITAICIVLCALAPHRELGARDAASPYTSCPTDTTETPVGISVTDDDMLVIRMRLPRARTVILALSVAALLAAGTAVLRRRRTSGSAHTPEPDRADSTEQNPDTEACAKLTARPHTDAEHSAAEYSDTKSSSPEPSPAATDATDATPTTAPDTAPDTAPATSAENEPSSDSAITDTDEGTDDIDLPLLTPPSGSDTHMLQRLNEFIAQHINEVDLSVNDLASAVYMSRSNLFRRLKALYGITPNEYLRRKRLLFAAALLRQNRYTISDVCFMVGFSSPSYFASCFRKQFGILPKNYIR